MSEQQLEVLLSRNEQHIEAAALIWAAATAARDGDPDVGTLEESRPLIEAALAEPQSALVLLILRRAEVVAFASVEPGSADGEAKIRYLAVRPDVWGRGLGSALMGALPERLRELGFESARLSVYADNPRAVTLYESAGWQATGAIGVHPKSGRRERYFELTPLAP